MYDLIHHLFKFFKFKTQLCLRFFILYVLFNHKYSTKNLENEKERPNH